MFYGITIFIYYNIHPKDTTHEKEQLWYFDEGLLYRMKRLVPDNKTTLTEIANEAFSEFVRKKK
jgi:hypothetical protein